MPLGLCVEDEILRSTNQYLTHIFHCNLFHIFNVYLLILYHFTMLVAEQFRRAVGTPELPTA